MLQEGFAVPWTSESCSTDLELVLAVLSPSWHQPQVLPLLPASVLQSSAVPIWALCQVGALIQGSSQSPGMEAMQQITRDWILLVWWWFCFFFYTIEITHCIMLNAKYFTFHRYKCISKSCRTDFPLAEVFRSFIFTLLILSGSYLQWCTLSCSKAIDLFKGLSSLLSSAASIRAK